MIVFVTGASAGFGAAIARRFVQAGHRVVATARRLDRLQALADELGEAQYDPGTPLSDDPVECAWQLAEIAPLGEYDRYVLLGATTMGGLLRQVMDLTLDAEALWSAE